MTSATYRQSSARSNANAATIDSDGSLYSRFSIRRLEAEIVRDRMLATCGRLDRTQFGPPVEVSEDFAGQVHVKDDSARRSVYVQVRRSKPVSILTAFDAPVMAVNCDRRSASTVAPQSLMLMNGDFALKQAEHLAKRLRSETQGDPDHAITEQFAGRFARLQSPWQYGYGFVEESAAGGVAQPITVRFQPLAHWTGAQWQGGPVLPDPVVGWALLHGAGGHAGTDRQRSVIRRWQAAQSGSVSVTGKLRHPSEAGDGVHSRIISSRSGVVGQWSAKTNSVDTNVAQVQVQPGDTIDFITDCCDNVNSDSFEWQVSIRLTDANGTELDRSDSAGGFHGPQSGLTAAQIASAWRLAYCRPITNDELEIVCQFLEQQLRTLRQNGAKGEHTLIALSSLCQQIMSSNEFLYLE